MNFRIVLALLLLFLNSGSLPASNREQIEVLLPSTQKRPPGSGMDIVRVKSARVDWWSVPKSSQPAVAATQTNSPIFVVLDFVHTRREHPECLIEELLPVMEDPAYSGRLRVLAIGGPKPYFQDLRGRYRTFRILDASRIDPVQIRQACRAPIDPATAAQETKVSFLVRLARVLGYSTTQMMRNWVGFDQARFGVRELIDEIPAKGMPARIFWLAEDFRAFDGPPNGCDVAGTENGTGIMVGGCASGGLVDRDLLYFFLSEITHAGAVITPVLLTHQQSSDPADQRRRADNHGAATRMARYTSAPVVVSDQKSNRALWAAIRESDQWLVASLDVPVVGMRAVITQPRKLTVTLTNGVRVERRFATKEGQMYVENLAQEVETARRLQRYAGSNPMPMGSAIAVPPKDANRAVLVSRNAAGSQPAWLLSRRLPLLVEAGCGLVASRTAGGHALLLLKVPEANWKGKGPVEVVLRGSGALAQSLTATREELQNGMCFGVPARDASGGFQLHVLDPETGAGGVFVTKK